MSHEEGDDKPQGIPNGLRPCGCLLDEGNRLVGTCAIHSSAALSSVAGYEEGFVAGLEAAAVEVSGHWNITGLKCDQKEQAERSAAVIRRLPIARSSRSATAENKGNPPILGYVNMPYEQGSGDGDTRVVGVKISLSAFARWRNETYPYMHLPIEWIRGKVQGEDARSSATPGITLWQLLCAMHRLDIAERFHPIPTPYARFDQMMQHVFEVASEMEPDRPAEYVDGGSK